MSDTELPPQGLIAPDPWRALRQHTPARIALGRSGSGLPTPELLRFAAAHAQARDAVHIPLDLPALQAELQADGWDSLRVTSRAATRDAYLRRPDWGRRLDEDSAQRLTAWADAQAQAPIPSSAKAQTAKDAAKPGSSPAAAAAAGPAPDLAIVLADGLSAVALQQHGRAVMRALRVALHAGPGPALRLAPLVLATQARVALADEVGQLLQARAVLILLGERPGLSSPDSLGAYLTHAPRVGRTDAERNCVSNIRPAGLPPEAAAQRLAWLVREALRRQLTGVGLKDDSDTALLPASA